MALHTQTHHRRNCKWCGREVDEFCSESHGLWIYLEPEPLSITVDLMDPKYLHRVYELRPRVGWCLKWAPAGRSWRELRETHECERMPRTRKSSVHKTDEE